MFCANETAHTVVPAGIDKCYVTNGVKSIPSLLLQILQPTLTVFRIKISYQK